MLGASPARVFALVAGSVYVLVGLAGFAATGVTDFFTVSNDTLLGFPVNGLHNVVHIGVGAVWIGASTYRTPGIAEGVNFGIGGFYVLAAILGYIGALDLINVPERVSADLFLHLVTGLVALPFAFMAGSTSRA